MPELGQDHSWNFVEIDSASDLMAMENPRQSRTQVDHEEIARAALPHNHDDIRGSVALKDHQNKNRERVVLQDHHDKRRERVALQDHHDKGKEREVLQMPGRGAPKRSRELVRRKKGLRRRVRGQNKLRPLDNIGKTNDNKEKDFPVQVIQSRLEEDNSKERANQAKDPATPRHFEMDVVGFGNLEEDNGSFPEGRSDSRDYYPSGSRKEQLLENKRSFSTSAGNGEPSDRNMFNDCLFTIQILKQEIPGPL